MLANAELAQDFTILNQQYRKLISALLRAEGNQSEAARILGVSRVTIWKRIKKYNVDLNADLAPI